MEDLIKAFLIFQKYIKPDDFANKYPTACEHDELYINVKPDIVSVEDKATLNKLGFHPCEEFKDCFISYRFGS